MINCRCPYCDKELSYVKVMSIRRRGEYYCNKCKKESNIHINKTIWIFFVCMMIPALVILGYYLFMTDRENVLFVLFVAIPFLLFYLFSPLFVRLRPKKKFQDALYDTEMVNTPMANPDPTMASSAKVAPAFMDDIGMSDDDYKPAINADVFNAIKEERKVLTDTDGGTRSFDRFENISSSGNMGDTKPVGNLKKIGSYDEEENDSYHLSRFR